MIRIIGFFVFVLCLSNHAAAQDLYVPSPDTNTPAKPASDPPKSAPVKTVSIDGTWSFQSDCDTGQYKGRMTFAGAGGTSDGTIDGTLSDVAVSGSKVSFTNSYSLFGRVTEDWSGKLSQDRNSISGKLSDSTGDHCVFMLHR